MSITAKSLFETSNFRPEVLANDAGRLSCLHLMSEEFTTLAKIALNYSGFSQRGWIRYDAGLFCLGHALELTYKILLLKDGIKYPKSHDYAKLFGCMTEGTQNDMHLIAQDAGWSSCDEFHKFLATDIDFVKRKYYEPVSVFDFWTNDRSGKLDHQLWPQVVVLCDRLHQYAASTIWLDPTLPSDAWEGR